MIRDGFREFKYRLKIENEDNIISYFKKIDGNKYKFNNIVQCSYIDYLVEKLAKMKDMNKIDVYKTYMPIDYNRLERIG